MPINKTKCLPFKDTWAAEGTELHTALLEKNGHKAYMIYERCEKERAAMESRYEARQGVSRGL